MINFLKITKRKIVFVFFFIAFVILLLASQLIPPWLDVIDIKQGADFLLNIIFRLPIHLFDFMTGHAFKPKECYALCFPTLPQAGFLILFDFLIVYLLACLYCRLRRSDDSK